MVKLFIKSIAILLLGTALYSCNLYPDDGTRVDDLDVVITLYDRTVDFGDYKTYYIIDSVAQINPDLGGQPIADNPLNEKNQELILDLIRVNLESRGFEEEERNARAADLVVNAGSITVSNINISSTYPNYYYGYAGGGWGYPGDYWGYPGYGYYYPWGPVYSVTEYEVGTLMIDIADSNVDTTLNRIPILWSGILRGVTNLTSDADVRNRIQIGINQAFEQSPYFQSN